MIEKNSSLDVLFWGDFLKYLETVNQTTTSVQYLW